MTRKIVVLLLFGLAFWAAHLSEYQQVAALENKLAATPPMGWMSWARFTNTVDCSEYPDDCLNERLFSQMADRMASDGYNKVGYKYINLDDCWSEKQRSTSDEKLVPDRSRFPNGLEPLAAHIHNRGLMFGIYGDCGTATCDGYPAQLKPNVSDIVDNYFDQDAEQFAAWKVDLFKFDGCNLAADKQEFICPSMANSLARLRRPILLTCEYPFYMLREHLQPNWTLVAEACNTWRYYEDIEDSWLSIMNIVDVSVRMQTTIVKYHGPGHWFDPDQLVIGNFALSLDQARAQMALWCLWSAPLYMGNDLRSIDSAMRAILLNEKLIQVDQDRLGVFGLMVKEAQVDGAHVQAFVKPVEPVRNGCPSFVVVYLNRATLGNRRRVEFKLRDLLVQMPIGLAKERQRQLYKGATPNDEISVDTCKDLLRKGMSRPKAHTPPPGLLVTGAGQLEQLQTQPVVRVPIEEQQVTFEQVDLFDDEPRKEIDLSSTLRLEVNPSGVRAIKLTMRQI